MSRNGSRKSLKHDVSYAPSRVTDTYAWSQCESVTVIV